MKVKEQCRSTQYNESIINLVFLNYPLFLHPTFLDSDEFKVNYSYIDGTGVNKIKEVNKEYVLTNWFIYSLIRSTEKRFVRVL